MKKLTVVCILLAVTASVLNARIVLPSVISDNMVLQQKTEAAIWGKAEPGSKVRISAGWTKDVLTVKADSRTGKWSAGLVTPEAGGPYDISISDGEETVLRNVLIGEVWFCSGQSNMEMPMKGYGSQPAKGATDFIIRAKSSRPIRICNIRRISSTKVLDKSEGNWQEHTPSVVAGTSATAYYFAEALQSVIDVPVGIIVTCWGGSSIETWIPREYMEKDFPEFSYGHLDGTEEVKKNNQDPCLLYNGQVAPLVPYTFKGMIWYQGETNRSRPEQYIRLQETYVRSMRELFRVPDAPFYFVQIAPFSYWKGNEDKWDSGYFCEAQQKSLSVIPHSGMAVTCDIGEFGTIHPCRKEEVGFRLALLALRHDYGMDAIEADAPTYKSVEFKDGKAFITFNVDELGISPSGADIEGFEIAGEDRIFHKATARRTDNFTISVSSPEVSAPAAVRYCFRNWCKGGLYNNYGIPAAPFRTDNWQLK